MGWLDGWEAATNWEAQKVKWFLVAALIFVFSWFMSCRELKYSIWGQTVDARITTTEKITQYQRYGGDIPKIRVNYTFKEPDGTVRKDATLFEPEGEIPLNTIKVQYLAGRDSPTRLAGEHNWVWIGIFGAMTLVMVAFIVKLAREANT